MLQGVTDVRKLFDYTLCARSGHTGIVAVSYTHLTLPTICSV